MKNIQVNISCILIALLIITGCKKNVAINEKQRILFQVDYVNYAWGYQHTGFIIDNEGNVRTYKNPQNWIFPDKDFNIIESQVLENFKSCLNAGNKIPAAATEPFAYPTEPHSRRHGPVGYTSYQNAWVPTPPDVR